MGYYDSKGFYVYQETDAADPGAGFSDLLNQSAKAIPNAVHGLVVDALAESETVIEAAAAAVAEALAVSGYAPPKCIHQEAGVWVWDGPGGALATHYLLPDHSGALVARPTIWPAPAGTPELNW